MASAGVRFSSPPATEVLQGIFFEAPPKFTAPFQGALWAECFRNAFPDPEEKPPIEETTEWFGDDLLRKAGSIQFRVSNKPDTPRIWAKSQLGDRILQIQSNALITNWLKKKEPSEYIPYDSRKKDFAERVLALQDFFRRENFGEVQPTSCLMTYVNHVEVNNLAEVPAIAASIFKFAVGQDEDSWLPSPDQFSLSVSYPIHDAIGRLHISANPAFRENVRKEKQPLLRFELAARGQPEKRTVESALAWLDIGHEWIVKGFVDVTKPSWHEKWGRQ